MYPQYTMVSTQAELRKAIATLGPRAALDFETTSLTPETGEVRLVSLCDGERGYLVDFFPMRGRFAKAARLFQGKREWVVFNSGFEQRWFLAAGAEVVCKDVAYLRAAILGGGRYKLKQLVAWDLDKAMDKTEQASDWGASELTQSQLDYAYGDAVDTWALYQHWYKQADERQLAAWALLDGMVTAVIEMETAGMLLDPDRHAVLVDEWREVQAAREASIRGLVPDDEVAKITSNMQWSDFFARLLPDHVLKTWPRTEKAGQLDMKGEVLRSIAAQFEVADPGNPYTTLLEALADWKKVTKYISSFGATLITSSQTASGRIHARFNIAAARTCRFSSSGPNLQQMPRDNELLGTPTSVRASFIAPRGRRLVSLDYSGIELRVLALLAEDDQLLDDVIYGDVHAEVAAVIAGHAIDKTTPEGKAARSKAKGVSFGIIYGSGAGGLSTTMRTSLSKAQDYIDFWRERYSRAFDYRNVMMREAEATRYIRVIDGGTIYMGRKPDLPKCANYPVQRAALSVMARAIIRHKASLDEARASGGMQSAVMLATIHDALIDETRAADAARCLKMMQRDMTEGYLDLFPGAPTDNLVEGGTGVTWSNLA